MRTSDAGDAESALVGSSVITALAVIGLGVMLATHRHVYLRNGKAVNSEAAFEQEDNAPPVSDSIFVISSPN
jgi:hypothetical protein